MPIALVDSPLDRGGDLRMPGQCRDRREFDAALPCPRRCHFRVQHDQGADIWPAVADGAGLPHQRVLLEQVLEVGRRDVLTAGGDDQLLLAVDDADVAVAVNGPDVAGVQPTVGVNCLCGLLWLLVVALGDVSAAHQQLAVIREGDLDAGVRDAHGPVSVGVEGGREGRTDGGLRHTPALYQVEADGLEELDHLGSDGRRPGDRKLALVDADLVAEGVPDGAALVGAGL